MSYLTSELTRLFLGFTKDSKITENDKLKLSNEYPLNYNESNRDIAVDSVRYSIFNGGIYQKFDLLNNLPEDANENFKLWAYDGVLKLVNFVLLPSPFPLKYYERCCISSTILTEIVDEMSVNLELLNDLFRPIIKYDKFVRDLLEISNEVYGPGGRKITEDLRTHISRSDYFIHIDNLDNQSSEREFCKNCQYDHCLCHFGRTATSQGDEKPNFKLVEINLGACSLSHYSRTVHKVHDKVLTTSIIDLYENDKDKTDLLVSEKKLLHIPNDPDSSFSFPVAESHKAYLNRYKPIFGQKRVCVFLISDINFINYFDTYFISNDVFDKYGIHVKTVQLDILIDWMKTQKLFLANEWEYNTDGTVNFTKYSCYGSQLKPGRLVLYLGSETNFTSIDKSNLLEVGTVYSRDYYDSSEMITDDSVSLRKLIEYSDAVKIPNILLQLANTKRAQMYFSDPDNVDTLLSAYNKRVKGVKRNDGLVDLVKQTAILQVDPSLESSLDVVYDALENPHQYVLKPNREIGRGLLFNTELADKLKDCLKNKEELSQYVLMRKISCPSQPGLFVKHLKNGSFEVNGYHSLTELGIYHYALYDGNECKINETNGYLARTKPEFATGGGIAAGHGFINTLLFY